MDHTPAPPQHPDDLLSIAEAARLAKRTPRTLRNRRYAGLAPRPVSRPGQRILYRRADILAWIVDPSADAEGK